MEIILRTTKFELPSKKAKSTKNKKEQDIEAITKFLPPLKSKPQVCRCINLIRYASTHMILLRVLFVHPKMFVINVIVH